MKSKNGEAVRLVPQMICGEHGLSWGDKDD